MRASIAVCSAFLVVAAVNCVPAGPQDGTLADSPPSTHQESVVSLEPQPQKRQNPFMSYYDPYNYYNNYQGGGLRVYGRIRRDAAEMLGGSGGGRGGYGGGHGRGRRDVRAEAETAPEEDIAAGLQRDKRQFYPWSSGIYNYNYNYNDYYRRMGMYY